ncbi:hypothetical protein [Thermococcus gorgonarius]|uniref:CARDB domain-containing protein n=1 Tax=Thermococcus gorgonarius TaxID=71997 RepID=A0A2Z2MAL3_THEGO|nr:hypothetical protein [Thermococcus gorgonarius]ASJ00954.1 hypothetical protein A3K92_05395 [Thermococcus gorgonarius]
MKVTRILMIVVLIGAFFSSPGFAEESPPFSMAPVIGVFDAFPGEELDVPVNVTNLLNESLSGLTVSLVWKAGDVALTANETLSLGPSESTIVHLRVKVPLLPPGEYPVKIEGKFGNFTLERSVAVRVEKLIRYSLSSDIGGFYTAGWDIISHIQVISKSNVPIQGTVRVFVLNGNESVVSSWNFTVSIDPGMKWSEMIRIPSLDAGNYTLVILADLSNVSQRLEKSFKVMARKYSYSAEFKGGVILVKVSFADGRPAKDIEIWINGTTLYTDENGEAVFVPPRQGVYLVRLNLDGVIVTKLVDVKCSYSYRAWYENGSVWIRVTDENGSPVSGIRINLLGQTLFTDENGLAAFRVNQTGVYEAELYLNHCTEKVSVKVDKLLVVHEVSADVLVLTVINSSGSPLPNVTVVIETFSNGTLSFRTNDDGKIFIPLDKLGSKKFVLTAEAKGYLKYSRIIDLSTLGKTSTSPGKNTTSTSTLPGGGGEKSQLPDLKTILVVVLSLMGLAGSSYLALARPHVVEEELDRYYFVKLKAPRMRPLLNFRWERGMNAVEVRAKRGKVRIEGSRVIWEVDELKPGEEAILQVLLG